MSDKTGTYAITKYITTQGITKTPLQKRVIPRGSSKGRRITIYQMFNWGLLKKRMPFIQYHKTQSV